MILADKSYSKIFKYAPLKWGIFFLCLVFASCNLNTDYAYIGGRAQGTTFNISFLDSLGRDLRAPIDSIFKSIDKSLSTYDSTSIISRINRNELNIADEHLVKVYTLAHQIFEESNGAFDITVGPLMKAYKFDKENHDLILKHSLDSILVFVGMDKVSLEGDRIIKQSPHIMFDVNAIAQGYTVDVIADYFEDNGINNYMVEVGGEVRAKGVNEGGNIWTIGIEDPVSSTVENRIIKKKISVNDKSICTSGNYRKYFLKDGIKYGHSINPITGLPAQNSLVSASVMANNATSADAYATALLVMGIDKAKNFVVSKPNLKVYLIYYDEGGELKVYNTLEK